MPRLDDSRTLPAIGREIDNWLDAYRMERLQESFDGPHGIVDFGADARPDEEALRFLEVPWELMAKGDRHIAAHPDLAFCPVRGVGKTADPRTPSEYRLSTLFMAAEPRGQETPLRYEEEETAILNAAGNIGMDLMVEESGNLELLAETMTRECPVDILHISRRGAVSPEPTLHLKGLRETRRTPTPMIFRWHWAGTYPGCTLEGESAEQRFHFYLDLSS